LKLTEFLTQTTLKFEKAEIHTARLDAEVITAHILGIEKYRLVTDINRELSNDEVEILEKAIKRRLSFEPVAYITGIKEFYSIDFYVTGDVLIPRPETELLVDMAIYWAGMGSSVLDLCTGSGAVAVALKKSRPDLKVYASDISDKALKIARKNADNTLGKGHVDFRKGDLYLPFDGILFDLIISNPPYIDERLAGKLQKELDYEPSSALYCGNGGKEVVARIIDESGNNLSDTGVLLLEIGSDQRAFIEEKGISAGYNVTVMNDYAGLARVATLKKF
jgi:release factor glutamine methyltransferase